MQSPAGMNQWREEMKARTHAFSVAVVAFLERIPDLTTTKRLKDQMLGAACGTDLNWHTACRARTHKEFASELGLVLKEAAEVEECFNVFHDAKLGEAAERARLRQESRELRAIFAKASRTANENEARLGAERAANRSPRRPRRRR
jgi:four helix bundle protein